MKRYLVTQGNSATHFLLAIFKGLVEDAPPRKHHARTPAGFEPDAKIVYLFCDPFDWIVATFRRNWVEDHTKHCGGDWEYFNRRPELTLSQYLITPFDAFKYREHAENWMGRALVVKYESLNASIDRICQHWGCGRPAGFKWEPRQTDWRKEPPGIQHGLNRKYGELRRWYSSLPDITPVFDTAPAKR